VLDLRIANGDLGLAWLASWACIGGLHLRRVRQMFRDEIESDGRRNGLLDEWLQMFRPPGSPEDLKHRRRVYREVIGLTLLAIATFLALDAAY